MGDDKNTEDLEDVSGGPDTVAPIITDALEGVGGGSAVTGGDDRLGGGSDSLVGVDGGGGESAEAGRGPSKGDLENVVGGDDANITINHH